MPTAILTSCARALVAVRIHAQVLEIDPSTRSISTFGHLGDHENTAAECSGSVHCGDEKWIGGVLVPSGKIIAIPYAAETVLEIDPATRTTTTFGIVSSSVKRKWVDGVLAKNGLTTVPNAFSGVIRP